MTRAIGDFNFKMNFNDFYGDGKSYALSNEAELT